MTTTEFAKIVTKRLSTVEQVLKKKESEYAEDDDRLVQFRKAGFLMGCHSVTALIGMLSKHTTSIYMMVGNPSAYSRAMWEEKITDHIAYLLLLEALLCDCLWRYDRDGEE